jgi:hypothetical protein
MQSAMGNISVRSAFSFLTDFSRSLSTAAGAPLSPDAPRSLRIPRLLLHGAAELRSSIRGTKATLPPSAQGWIWSEPRDAQLSPAPPLSAVMGRGPFSASSPLGSGPASLSGVAGAVFSVAPSAGGLITRPCAPTQIWQRRPELGLPSRHGGLCWLLSHASWRHIPAQTLQAPNAARD